VLGALGRFRRLHAAAGRSLGEQPVGDWLYASYSTVTGKFIDSSPAGPISDDWCQLLHTVGEQVGWRGSRTRLELGTVGRLRCARYE
jgi:hypothetical protein